MSDPVRVQLSRAKGWRMPENTVKVSRPGLFGNPWPVEEARQCLIDLGEDGDPASLAVEWFRVWITGTSSQGRWLPPKPSMIRDRLRGKNLACWCRLDAPCHADVLLELANRPVCEAVA